MPGQGTANRLERMSHHELRIAAEEAARLGGSVLAEWAGNFTAREKSPANLVTEADFASQDAIHRLLKARFPEHQFFGEEGLATGSDDSPYRWLIDPLDGTSNYVHGFPYYAVSIAVEYQGDLLAGAIYDPNRDEMFSAAKGEGATLNGGRILVSGTSRLTEAMCMASLPVKTTRDHPTVQRFLRVLEVAQTVQRSGSAALNLCSVACGRIDAFWSSSLKPWDMAAGVVIVREAGGKVTTGSGGPFDVNRADLLSSNGTALHEELCRLLSQ